MATLSEIQQQIDELLRQKKEILSTQKAEIISTIKKQIADFEITAEELGFSSSSRNTTEKSDKPRKPVKVKYRNPETGDTWSGRGMKPKWCQTIISDKGMEYFEKHYGVNE